MEPGTLKIAAEAAKELGIKEIAPKAYEDVLQPAAKEAGQQLLVVAKTVRVALAPLEGIVWCYDQTKAYVSAKVAAKLASKPANEIASPDKTIAGPLLLNLAFAADAPHLKELYSNLLANAMHVPTASHVHPSFVYVIQQLTPAEAQILKVLSSKFAGAVPIFTEKVTPLMPISNPELSSMLTLLQHSLGRTEEVNIAKQWDSFCTTCGVTDTMLSQTLLRNLIRLGIFAENLVWVKRNSLLSMLSGPEMDSDGILTRELRLSDYGNLFLDLCVRDEPVNATKKQPTEAPQGGL
ncbi:MAG TPA: DUF4393 domain-containing protein [Clostridia bacterium]|nr:DUF4393 domain-containing protein [Clostridia bacterium]